MSRGPDDDDDLPIEILSDWETSPEGAFGSGPVTATAPVPLGPFEAAGLEAAAEIDLYLGEAALAEPARAAPLLHEAAYLRQTALGDGAGALAAYRDALARDATFVATLPPLRRLLAEKTAWDDLANAYEMAIRAGAFGTDARRSRRVADLWVERGLIQEDRLSKPDEAAQSYRAAAVAAPDHATAQLARLMGAARARDQPGLEAALAGLIDCAEPPTRRAALAAELARVQRLAPPAPAAHEGGGAGAPQAAETPAPEAAPETDTDVAGAGAARALETLRRALASAGDETPRGGLVSELERLAGLRAQPPIQVGALEELARVVPADQPAAKVALHRERARVLRDVIRDLEAAHAALSEARRILPEHPLLTTDLLDVADQLGSVELVRQTLESSAIPQDELLAAARLVDVLGRAGRAGEALEVARKYASTSAWAAGVPSDPRPDAGTGTGAGAGAAASAVVLTALASRIALHAETGDAIGLADAFEAEGEQGQGLGAAHAFVRAATLRDLVLHDARHAEVLYRKALDRSPGYPPAIDALEEMLRVDARWAELAEALERELAALDDGEAQEPRRRYLLAALVGLHRDRLGQPARALVFQRARVALDPLDLDGWMLARDLEVAVAVSPAGPTDPGAGAGAPTRQALLREGVTTVIQLCASAGQPAVTAALEIEAAALVTDDASLAERFLRDAAVDDRTGIAAGSLTAQLADAKERRRAVAAELAAADTRGQTDVARALRHRLAVERARAGEWRDAVAVLAPAWNAGDECARAFSFDRARLSGDAALEVQALGDGAASAATAGLVAPSDLGEAHERAGNGDGAQQAFREVLRRGRSPDAALGLLRTAALAGNYAGVTDALRAIGDMSFDDSGATIAATATREADLLDLARGQGPANPAASPATDLAARPEADLGLDADDAFAAWLDGVRRVDHGQVAGAFIALARLSGGVAAASPESARLLARAAARSRLAGSDIAEAVHRRAWAAAPGNAAVAQSISDVRTPLSGPDAHALPDTRAERAAHLPPAAAGLAIDLDLERALEQEAGGQLGEALDVYGRILARDPDCLEAMIGVRRLARSGGDLLGEARALARLGALVKTPVHAAAFFAEAAPLYERAGHREQAVAAYLKVLEHAPDDDDGFQRLMTLLRAGVDQPGNAKTLDRVLGHRLQRTADTAAAPQRIAWLGERAANRLARLDDRDGAVEDFKRILKIDPRDERALRQIATLAIEMQHPADAARFLLRYLEVTRDETAAAVARLELATAHEEAGDRTRAIEALRGAAVARAHDPLPLQRLTELHLRTGDWQSAIGSLRAWEAVIDSPVVKAELHLRLGTLLRDDAYDLPQAALAFRRAAELDPLGEGTRELALLHESAGDEPGRIAVMEHAIAELRGALDRDPLDLAHLQGLKRLLDGAWRDGRGRDARQAVAQVMALLGAPPTDLVETPSPPWPLVSPLPDTFWAALVDPPAQGFMTEVWMLLADAVLELHPPDVAALGAVRQNRIAGEGSPALAPVVQTAAAVGLPSLILHRVPGRSTSVAEDEVQPVELPAPGLVLGAGVDAGAGPAAFSVGRALGLLRYRATAVARLPAEELQGIFDAAAVLAGAASDAPGSVASRASEAQVKALSKALARKERKALALQASRFGFEPIDAGAWRAAILRAADRLGLVLAGDVRLAAAGAATRAGTSAAPLAPSELRRTPAVVDVVRFALGEAYLTARREASPRKAGH